MRGRELLKVVERLAAGKPPTEPFRRSAVSRAYYAAFSELSHYLSRQSYSRGKSSSPHDHAWNHLKNGISDHDVAREARRRAVADTGFRLKKRRQKADYQLDARLANDEAADALKEARRIVKELDAL
ncbi:MAG: hypothetical protein ACTHNY_07820 [Solirubrobacterales bacterium]